MDTYDHLIMDSLYELSLDQHIYYNQNYWVFGLFSSSDILETRKHDVSETGSVSVFRWRGEKTPIQFGPLGRKQIQFPKRRVF
jgi:hypothetical protein